MTELNTPETQAAQVAATPEPQAAPVLQSAQALEPVATTQTPTPETPAGNPAPVPVKLELLRKHDSFVYTDKNGYEWPYEVQFPGMRELYDMIDDAGRSTSKLYDAYLKYVVVSPAGLTIDSFNDRPGLAQVMDKVDTFLVKAQGI
ncbi:hypothetical protein [Loigolactobacillus bifermentans]|uniref:Uncharacterized protein n=1 Tax=Loigolactobacillus bifermentans DSM 20003 TaxID=1423726 RepID=A0A0R1H2J6_9LACO|nr:hypothetical protein [Loigolactobacillus bifermentans]KRK40796.1 hypothetical protein FC07_GL002545 [Loigolactobacillus bifermentans DSM 20003]QGG59548.1 hypothetical protein LB003_03110 [Loigolactobacillus bifermentans]